MNSINDAGNRHIASGYDQWGPADRPQPSGDNLLRLDDTREYWGCEYGRGIFTVLDTGRAGPDDVKIVIHEDGSSTVSVNGVEYNYSREQTSNLRVRVDDNDKVQVEDHRSDPEKAMNPNPIQIFNYPE